MNSDIANIDKQPFILFRTINVGEFFLYNRRLHQRINSFGGNKDNCITITGMFRELNPRVSVQLTDADGELIDEAPVSFNEIKPGQRFMHYHERHYPSTVFTKFEDGVVAVDMDTRVGREVTASLGTDEKVWRITDIRL